VLATSVCRRRGHKSRRVETTGTPRRAALSLLGCAEYIFIYIYIYIYVYTHTRTPKVLYL